MRIQLVTDQRKGRTYFALYIYKKKKKKKKKKMKKAWLPKFVLKFAENTKIQFLFLFFSFPLQRSLLESSSPSTTSLKLLRKTQDEGNNINKSSFFQTSGKMMSVDFS
ncbi:hypothetical protein ACN38_g12547 [Penicillium nordicum]|uniref:Uncharacterized protein n=1 Tax=Penicillium nordicum TaxID=229535 RepID=A0A0M9W9U7_9EURO|nr:hypothetical protein ACN38_g12547 [Penicillium nordicum]